MTELEEAYNKLEDLESDYEIIKVMSGDKIEMAFARKKVMEQIKIIQELKRKENEVCTKTQEEQSVS